MAEWQPQTGLSLTHYCTRLPGQVGLPFREPTDQMEASCCIRLMPLWRTATLKRAQDSSASLPMIWIQSSCSIGKRFTVRNDERAELPGVLSRLIIYTGPHDHPTDHPFAPPRKGGGEVVVVKNWLEQDTRSTPAEPRSRRSHLSQSLSTSHQWAGPCGIESGEQAIFKLCRRRHANGCC